MLKINFSGVQQLGRALMLPIAVLPVAALLLRFGQPDLLNLPFVANAGSAIFTNLGILFAIGIAVGFAKENNGAAGLAGAVGFFIITKGAGTILAIPPEITEAVAKATFVTTEISKMSIPIGIVAGITAGLLYNRFYAIKLPEFLSFFGGRRFVPIVTGFVCLIWGALFGFAWAPLSGGLDAFSAMLTGAGGLGLFLYGALNRLLIVTGLHHILNNVVWFVHGTFEHINQSTGLSEIVRGDLNRFFAGDKSAGAFMSGFFPVMMFGLPAACLAMYRNALPANKAATGGILLSMALTSFLTGITEPIEFSFMFLAPVLYAVHAVLTGISAFIMNFFDIKLGFGFSAGLIDYVLNFSKATNPLYLLPIGAVYFVVYFLLFDFAIRKFNLKTIGRDVITTFGRKVELNADEKTLAMIAALGGAENLKSVDACTTRLRLQVADNSIIDEAALKSLGARGIVTPGAGALQVILGPIADTVASSIRTALHDSSGENGVDGKPLPPAAHIAKPSAAATIKSDADAKTIDSARTGKIIEALGGAGNIKNVKVEALTRARVELNDAGKVNEKSLNKAGIAAVMPLPHNAVYLIAGKEADAVAAALSASL